jgi:hypothetical protein
LTSGFGDLVRLEDDHDDDATTAGAGAGDDVVGEGAN